MPELVKIISQATGWLSCPVVFQKLNGLIEISSFKALEEMQGQNFPPSPWIEVTQEMINGFADATFDHQWIHVDEVRAAKESPFQKTIAHGFLSLSLIPKFVMDSFEFKSLRMGYNYGFDRVRFPHPVPVGSRVRGHIIFEKMEPYQDTGFKFFWKIMVELEGAEKPACVANLINVAFE